MTALCPLVAHAKTEYRVEQMTREVSLDPNDQVHRVTVYGWLGMTTGIRFPDSFNAGQVLCGQCLEMREGGKHEADPNHATQYNWLLDKRPEDRFIYLRPAMVPDADTPPSAYATNIHILLDGGHVVVVDLRLSARQDDTKQVQVQADALVTLSLPYGTTLTGRLAEERKKMKAEIVKQILEGSTQMMLQVMTPATHCQDIRWRRPYRHDKTVMRLNQLCHNSARSTLWVTFTVENRGATVLYLDGATLEPQTDRGGLGESVFAFNQKVVPPDATADGIALWQLKKVQPKADALHRDSTDAWSLRLIPSDTNRTPVVIEHLTF
ncbi:MAG: hypothetical protein EOO40_02015 [Deltaproteobacteria bacterium]|nr:MAG: hypothetical protein EOO40_02015 [Deltaproteobacteria bacterium]